MEKDDKKFVYTVTYSSYEDDELYTESRVYSDIKQAFECASEVVDQTNEDVLYRNGYDVEEYGCKVKNGEDVSGYRVLKKDKFCVPEGDIDKLHERYTCVANESIVCDDGCIYLVKVEKCVLN